jgi:ribosomal protein S18 acetylase RimI-like enzyme
MKLTVLPLTPRRWRDLEALFGARGCSAARGCWCMAYRRSGRRPPVAKRVTRGEANRAELKALVDRGTSPGLIAYRGSIPVGWISIGLREEFAKLDRSPVMKPVDDKPVWSIVCYVVPSEHRRQGVGHALLQRAVAYARKRGAVLIEAYPIDRAGRSRDTEMWFGSKSMYDRAGFKEVARRKPGQPIMRLRIRQAPARKSQA